MVFLKKLSLVSCFFITNLLVGCGGGENATEDKNTPPYKGELVVKSFYNSIWVDLKEIKTSIKEPKFKIYISNNDMSGIDLDNLVIKDRAREIKLKHSQSSIRIEKLKHNEVYYILVAINSNNKEESVLLPQKKVVTTSLQDTGLTIFSDLEKKIESSNEKATGQDGLYGRDVASDLKKISQGNYGFDFSLDEKNKYVIDNVTNLMWEKKSKNKNSLNWVNERYSWYNEKLKSSDENPGLEGKKSYDFRCKENLAICNTQKFVEEMNKANYGGYNDWRLPTVEELVSLVDLSTSRGIDESIFGYSDGNIFNKGLGEKGIVYWSSNSSYGKSFIESTISSNAYGVQFDSSSSFMKNGIRVKLENKSSGCYVRLVRDI